MLREVAGGICGSARRWTTARPMLILKTIYQKFGQDRRCPMGRCRTTVVQFKQEQASQPALAADA
jgi:hypothetical protein